MTFDSSSIDLKNFFLWIRNKTKEKITDFFGARIYMVICTLRNASAWILVRAFFFSFQSLCIYGLLSTCCVHKHYIRLNSINTRVKHSMKAYATDFFTMPLWMNGVFFTFSYHWPKYQTYFAYELADMVLMAARIYYETHIYADYRRWETMLYGTDAWRKFIKLSHLFFQAIKQGYESCYWISWLNNNNCQL